MPAIPVLITRYVDDEPFPGLVECEFVDFFQTTRRFIDKAPVFSRAPLSRDSRYPSRGSIVCEVVSRHVASSGQRIARVSTLKPHGIKAIDGSSEFDLLEEVLTDVT